MKTTAALLLLAGVAAAEDFYWRNDVAWNTKGNWDLNAVPDKDTMALIGVDNGEGAPSMCRNQAEAVYVGAGQTVKSGGVFLGEGAEIVLKENAEIVFSSTTGAIATQGWRCKKDYELDYRCGLNWATSDGGDAAYRIPCRSDDAFFPDSYAVDNNGAPVISSVSFLTDGKAGKRTVRDTVTGYAGLKAIGTDPMYRGFSSGFLDATTQIEPISVKVNGRFKAVDAEELNCLDTCLDSIPNDVKSDLAKYDEKLDKLTKTRAYLQEVSNQVILQATEEVVVEDGETTPVLKPYLGIPDKLVGTPAEVFLAHQVKAVYGRVNFFLVGHNKVTSERGAKPLVLQDSHTPMEREFLNDEFTGDQYVNPKFDGLNFATLHDLVEDADADVLAEESGLLERNINMFFKRNEQCLLFRSVSATAKGEWASPEQTPLKAWVEDCGGAYNWQEETGLYSVTPYEAPDANICVEEEDMLVETRPSGIKDMSCGDLNSDLVTIFSLTTAEAEWAEIACCAPAADVKVATCNFLVMPSTAGNTKIVAKDLMMMKWGLQRTAERVAHGVEYVTDEANVVSWQTYGTDNCEYATPVYDTNCEAGDGAKCFEVNLKEATGNWVSGANTDTEVVVGMLAAEEFEYIDRTIATKDIEENNGACPNGYVTVEDPENTETGVMCRIETNLIDSLIEAEVLEIEIKVVKDILRQATESPQLNLDKAVGDGLFKAGATNTPSNMPLPQFSNEEVSGSGCFTAAGSASSITNVAAECSHVVWIAKQLGVAASNLVKVSPGCSCGSKPSARSIAYEVFEEKYKYKKHIGVNPAGGGRARRSKFTDNLAGDVVEQLKNVIAPSVHSSVSEISVTNGDYKDVKVGGLKVMFFNEITKEGRKALIRPGDISGAVADVLLYYGMTTYLQTLKESEFLAISTSTTTTTTTTATVTSEEVDVPYVRQVPVSYIGVNPIRIAAGLISEPNCFNMPEIDGGVAQEMAESKLSGAREKFFWRQDKYRTEFNTLMIKSVALDDEKESLQIENEVRKVALVNCREEALKGTNTQDGRPWISTYPSLFPIICKDFKQIYDRAARAVVTFLDYGDSVKSRYWSQKEVLLRRSIELQLLYKDAFEEYREELVDAVYYDAQTHDPGAQKEYNPTCQILDKLNSVLILTDAMSVAEDTLVSHLGDDHDVVEISGVQNLIKQRSDGQNTDFLRFQSVEQSAKATYAQCTEKRSAALEGMTSGDIERDVVRWCAAEKIMMQVASDVVLDFPASNKQTVDALAEVKEDLDEIAEKMEQSRVGCGVEACESGIVSFVETQTALQSRFDSDTAESEFPIIIVAAGAGVALIIMFAVIIMMRGGSEEDEYGGYGGGYEAGAGTGAVVAFENPVYAGGEGGGDDDDDDEDGGGLYDEPETFAEDAANDDDGGGLYDEPEVVDDDGAADDNGGGYLDVDAEDDDGDDDDDDGDDDDDDDDDDEEESDEEDESESESDDDDDDDDE